jgi:hypothetical protein
MGKLSTVSMMKKGEKSLASRTDSLEALFRANVRLCAHVTGDNEDPFLTPSQIKKKIDQLANSAPTAFGLKQAFEMTLGVILSAMQNRPPRALRILPMTVF